jgi:hypothetical protein
MSDRGQKDLGKITETGSKKDSSHSSPPTFDSSKISFPTGVGGRPYDGSKPPLPMETLLKVNTKLFEGKYAEKGSLEVPNKNKWHTNPLEDKTSRTSSESVEQPQALQQSDEKLVEEDKAQDYYSQESHYLGDTQISSSQSADLKNWTAKKEAVQGKHGGEIWGKELVQEQKNQIDMSKVGIYFELKGTNIIQYVPMMEIGAKETKYVKQAYDMMKDLDKDLSYGKLQAGIYDIYTNNRQDHRSEISNWNIIKVNVGEKQPKAYDSTKIVIAQPEATERDKLARDQLRSTLESKLQEIKLAATGANSVHELQRKYKRENSDKYDKTSFDTAKILLNNTRLIRDFVQYNEGKYDRVVQAIDETSSSNYGKIKHKNIHIENLIAFLDDNLRQTDASGV